MKRAVCVIVLAGALSGCAALDDLLDVEDDKAPMDVPVVVETAADATRTLPFGAIIAGGIVLLAGAYRTLRKKKETDGQAD